MGGAQAGELASRLAADALEERAHGHRGAETLVDLVQEANERIYRRALDDPAAAGMGTTVTVALVDEERGDGRARATSATRAPISSAGERSSS